MDYTLSAMDGTCDSAYLLLNQITGDLWSIRDILSFIGLFYVGKVAVSLTWSVIRGMRIHMIPKIHSCDNLPLRYGEWAVVTGCTDGIGKAYVYELARRGMNIVLISRNATKLKEVAEDVKQEFGVDSRIIAVDFSLGRAVYAIIDEGLKDLDIGILVNNVGVISSRPEYVIEMSDDALWNHLNINIGTVTSLTRSVLPKMMEQKRGAIINLASLTANAPVPMLAVYSASKAYVSYFSQALSYECRGTGVDVQTLTPSYINTKMVAYSGALQNSGIFVPDPKLYVRHALSTLGVADTTSGYWLHDLQWWFLSCLPLQVWMYLCSTANHFLRARAPRSMPGTDTSASKT